MKGIILCIFFLISACSLFSQTINDTLQQKAITEKFKAILPEDYTVIDTTEADFNNGKVKEIVLVAAFNNDDDSSRAIIIVKDSGNHYEVIAKCLSAILCKSCGGIFGDPYADMSFKNNVLKIYHYGGSAWRWSQDYTFRYQNNAWELIGIAQDSYWSMGDCDGTVGNYGRNFKEVNFSTKKMHTILNSEKAPCKMIENKWVKFNSFKKVTLQDFDVNQDYFKFIQ